MKDKMAISEHNCNENKLETLVLRYCYRSSQPNRFNKLFFCFFIFFIVKIHCFEGGRKFILI